MSKVKKSANGRIDSQTGSERGTFKKWDKHPWMEDRYFRCYAKRQDGTYQECWLTLDALKRHKQLVADHQTNNPEMHKARNERWLDRNRDEVRKRRRDSRANKLKNDPIYRLKGTCRSRLSIALKRKGMAKSESTDQALGTSVENLKRHLESMFQDGMSWENMGSDWHIDHIIPLDCATTVDGVYKLSHYTNLQPLWAADNIRKKNNLVLCQN